MEILFETISYLMSLHLGCHLLISAAVYYSP